MRWLIALVLAACAAAAPAAAAEKVFNYHLTGPPENLDPVKCSNLRCLTVMWPIYEPLIDVGEGGRGFVPRLAESWTTSPDGLAYRFRLRRNVVFHDGTPFTATAAKLNLDRHFVPGSRFYTATPPNVRERTLGDVVKEVTVQDEQTLTVTLKARALHILTLVPMVSAAALSRARPPVGEHPVGTGPFTFGRWTTDEIRVTANRDYWGGRPRLDAISFRILPKLERAMQDLLEGRLDFSPEVEPVYQERLIGNPTTRLYRVPTLSIYYLGFALGRKPLDDLRVRQAFAKAIDVDRAVLFSMRGSAVAAHGPLPPAADGYDPALRRPSHDPEGARALLAEAGHARGLHVTLLVNISSGFLSEVAQAITADLAKVRVTVQIVPVPSYRELLAEVRGGRGDLFIYNWFSIFHDPERFLVPNFQTGAVDNLTRYSNPAVDTLFERARLVPEPAERLELYRRAQRLVAADVPWVFLFHRVRISAYNTRVLGLDLNVFSLPLDRFHRVDVRPE